MKSAWIIDITKETYIHRNLGLEELAHTQGVADMDVGAQGPVIIIRLWFVAFSRQGPAYGPTDSELVPGCWVEEKEGSNEAEKEEVGHGEGVGWREGSHGWLRVISREKWRTGARCVKGVNKELPFEEGSGVYKRRLARGGYGRTGGEEM